MVRIGVIDLGGNTFHLAIAEAEPKADVVVVDDDQVRVRMVHALQAGWIDEASWATGLAALRRLVERAQGCRLVCVATSAFRDAQNGSAFVRAAERELGITIEVLDGAAEAGLAYRGSRSDRPIQREPVAVVDVGGGSVELAVGRGDEVLFARSLPLGVLRLLARHLPAGGAMHASDARAIGRHVVEQAGPAVAAARTMAPRTLVLSAGTARELHRIATALPDGPPPGHLGRKHVLQLEARLLGKTPEALVEMGIAAGRRDTIGPGAVLIATLMKLLGASTAQVSQRGLREGVLLRERDRIS